MTVPGPDFEPVSRESFLEDSSFYTALASKRPGDKLVLIRLPSELQTEELHGCLLEMHDDTVWTQDETVLGRVRVEEPRNTESVSGGSALTAAMRDRMGRGRVSKTRMARSFVLRSSHEDKKASVLALAQPVSAVGSLQDPQMMRTHCGFDAMWTVGLDVAIPAVNSQRVEAAVRQRVERPLVEQPRGLRMRLLPFSTPRSDRTRNTGKGK